MSAEVESVESLLEKAGKEPLEEGELAELRRILYGKAAKYEHRGSLQQLASFPGLYSLHAHALHSPESGESGYLSKLLFVFAARERG